MTTAIIIPIIILHNTLNNVIRNIMLITVTINLLELLINFSLGTLFLLDCDLDTITQGRHLILHKSYQIFSIWTLVTYSTLTYELSRTRYYFAKHAFRIHKLSTLHISAQVISIKYCIFDILVKIPYLGYSRSHCPIYKFNPDLLLVYQYISFCKFS